MPENSAIEVVDKGTFNLVQTIPVITYKSNYSVEGYKAMIAEHQTAIMPEALIALVQAKKDEHNAAIATMSAVLKAAAAAGVVDAVQAVTDLGL